MRLEQRPAVTGGGAARVASRLAVPAVLLLTAIVAPGRTGAAAAGIQQAGSQPPPSAQRALLSRYCISCHNERLKTAGLRLDALDLDNLPGNAVIWEKVVRKVRAGMMPPAGRPRPDAAAADGFAAWIEGEIDRAAAAHPAPGRTEPFHRLNRAEYQNAIRDLLALEVDVTAQLPPDDASYGFDNIAGVLKVSPTLLERYLSAAQRISRLAVGTPVLFPSVDTYRVQEDAPQDDRVDGLPFGTRGGTEIRYNAPLDGEYTIEVRLSREANNGATEDVPKFTESHDLEVAVDDQRAHLFTLAAVPESPKGPRVSRKDVDADWALRLPLRAGPRRIAVTFIRKSSAVDEPLRLPFLRPIHYADGRYEPYLGKVTIVGPHDAVGAGDTPSRQRLFVCRPANRDDLACARQILGTLARRAYRRPVTDTDLDPLLALFKEGAVEGGFDAGLQRGVELVLASPDFLFRVERDPAGAAPGTVYRISDLELASRLSFFIWSSVPDDELLDAAIDGSLGRPAVLERQVRRMLGDRRAGALVANFAGQWLFLRNLPAITPDPRIFPDFDDSLRQALRRETELFVESIFRDDRSVLDLLTADYTFLNERLARHYGITTVKGSHFRRVPVVDENRRGLLGHGSILTVTAYAHRTSPVLRGKWVLENLLGTPPPPPPPDVPPLDEKPGAGAPKTMRERMSQHRSNAVCAGCHSLMDPPGLALESFDAVGRWRTLDEHYAAIDASGTLPDGTTFDGVAGLRQALLGRSELLVSTFTEKLLTYALGRGLEYYDAPAVRRIVRDAAREQYRTSSIILGIVNSVPFQMRGSAHVHH